MILQIIGHPFRYEMECLCRVYFPYEKISVVDSDTHEAQKVIVRTEILRINDIYEMRARVDVGSRSKTVIRKTGIQIKQDSAECEREMAAALYEAMTQLTGYIPGWGLLTGVRPAKLLLNLIGSMGEPGALAYFQEKLLVSTEKTKLALSVAKHEEKIIKKVKSNCFSLYIAIPFCLSRCSYCSFVSHSIAGNTAKKIIPRYIELLCNEIAAIGQLAANLNLNPQTIYFGGGTPTSLDAIDLDRLLREVKKSFDLSEVEEYTVEAGRPDTVTIQKLKVLKKYDISRISINPQSFNDFVLEKAGRKHDSNCTLDAYRLARSCGIESINMDLIAGLPDDTAESFKKTVDITLDLDPENITVHTLARKRAANLNIQNSGDGSDNGTVAEMLHTVNTFLPRAGYEPYYMYRQSLSLGNHENVGWSKPGYEGLYNVIMMEECQTVLAAGAGGVTKLISPICGKLERVFNFKYPYEYNNRYDEIIDRKSKIIRFYKTFV